MLSCISIRVSAERAAKSLLGPFLDSPRSAIAPRGGWRPLMYSFIYTYIFTWALRGFVGVIVAYFLSTMIGASHLNEAVREGLAPKFWNLVVMLGLLYAVASAAFAQLVPKNKESWIYSITSSICLCCHNSASALLRFASQLGALSFGIVVGMFIVASVKATDSVPALVETLGGTFLLGIVFFFNVIVWYIAYAILDDAERPLLFQYWSEKSRIYKAVFSVAGFLILLVITLYVGGA